jgi:FdhE protein
MAERAAAQAARTEYQESHPRFEVLIMSAVDGPKSVPKSGTILGEMAKPPFAVLPAPLPLFEARSRRFAALAPGHRLETYLLFLADVTHAQHDVAAAPELPPALLPPTERIAQALGHGMPPVSRALFEPDDGAMAAVERLLERLAIADMPAETAAALAGLRTAPPDERRRKVHETLMDTEPADDLAQRVLIAAGLQVHFTRLAAQLRADDLKLVAEGACPVCGSPPMTSAVVAWAKAHNTRFCTCSLCATMWNVVRVKCLVCTSTDGISFREIEGSANVKAETCDMCRSYVKILYQVNDPALDPMADDVASLGLDMLLSEEGWKRGGHNPFLLGY